MTLKEALQVLIDEHLDDWVYKIRDSASSDRKPEEEHLNSWELPRVKRFDEACQTIKGWLGA